MLLVVFFSYFEICHEKRRGKIQNIEANTINHNNLTPILIHVIFFERLKMCQFFRVSLCFSCELLSSFFKNVFYSFTLRINPMMNKKVAIKKLILFPMIEWLKIQCSKFVRIRVTMGQWLEFTHLNFREITDILEKGCVIFVKTFRSTAEIFHMSKQNKSKWLKLEIEISTTLEITSQNLNKKRIILKKFQNWFGKILSDQNKVLRVLLAREKLNIAIISRAENLWNSSKILLIQKFCHIMETLTQQPRVILWEIFNFWNHFLSVLPHFYFFWSFFAMF